jgi:DNA-binding response OmpR family regulator
MMKVLIADDDAALADVIRRNLAAHGHQCSTAGSAQEAVLKMVEEWPEALVIDVNLPDYTAWEVLRRLDAASRQQLRVVVISGAPISQKRIQEFRPDGALQKPFPMGSLLRILEQQPVVLETEDPVESRFR